MVLADGLRLVKVRADRRDNIARYPVGYVYPAVSSRRVIDGTGYTHYEVLSPCAALIRKYADA